MFALRQPLKFSIRNHYKSRSFASFVRSTVFENRSTIRIPQKFPVQVTSCDSSIQFDSLVIQKVQFSSEVSTLSQLDYEHFCAETLDELCDYFEELVESVNDLATADVLNKVNFKVIDRALEHINILYNRYDFSHRMVY